MKENQKEYKKTNEYSIYLPWKCTMKNSNPKVKVLAIFYTLNMVRHSAGDLYEKDDYKE